MSGDLQRDKAFNKMAKLLERSRGNHDKPETIVEQLKRVYGEEWRNELEEMSLESSHPTYRADKEKATRDIERDYELTVPRWDRTNENRSRWMRKGLNKWREAYAYSIELDNE